MKSKVFLQRQYPLPKGKTSKLFKAYYSLATKILLQADSNHRGQAFLITSAVPGEGKTYTTINLACNLAIRQKRVLMVEANPWNRIISHRFNLEKKKGLMDVLETEEIIEKTQFLTDFPGLHLLGIGGTPGLDFIQFLLSHFGSWLTEARKTYDVILLDSTSINSHDEAKVIAPMTDGVLLVVRAQKTPMREILTARDTIHKVEGNLLGIVINAYREYIPRALRSWF